jgi:hypothetical protein
MGRHIVGNSMYTASECSQQTPSMFPYNTLVICELQYKLHRSLCLLVCAVPCCAVLCLG